MAEPEAAFARSGHKNNSKQKERLRIAAMKNAYGDLKKVLPVHPKDSKSKRLNRVQIIRRAIKYIHCLGHALQVSTMYVIPGDNV